MKTTSERKYYPELVKVPDCWRVIQRDVCGFPALMHPLGLRAIVTVAKESDGKRWMHVSLSRPDRLPTWEDLKLVKSTLIGKDKLAIQVLPPEAEYVNTHPYCLHLWHCLDGRAVPDFRGAAGQI